MAVLEVRGVRKAVTNGRALPGSMLRAPQPVGRGEALPVHTWLPRLTSERRQRRIAVWGFAERRRVDYHSSVESHSVRLEVRTCQRAEEWPDATLALAAPGCVWTGSVPKSAVATARGLLTVRGDTQERSLDLHQLFDPRAIAPPATPDALLHVRAVVLKSEEPFDRSARQMVEISGVDGADVPATVDVRWDERRDPLDPSRTAERYMLVTLALDRHCAPLTVQDMSEVLQSALHHFTAHEVLVRSAQAINDDLSTLVRDLLADETELHRVDNIKRDIAQLQREFTDELEAAWAFDAKLGGRTAPLMRALDTATDVGVRWDAQRKRFDRLASIADFAPTVGPPVAGPRNQVDAVRVGSTAAGQIRLERRMGRQAEMAYSRWWQSRGLHAEGVPLPDTEARMDQLGRFWGRVYDLCAGIDVRIEKRQNARALTDQERADVGYDVQPKRRGARELLGSRSGRPAQANKPRLIELHPFRNRSYLFEELNGAIQRTTFLAAATLVFLGAVLQTRFRHAASDVDLLLIFLAVFGFLFSTLMFGRLTTRLARRTTIDYDGRFRTADRVSDYLGVFPLLLALPLIIFRFVESEALQLVTAALAVVATAFHLRLSSRLHIDVADDALSTAAFRAALSAVLLGSMTVTLLAAVGQVPGTWLTTFASVYVAILLFLTVASAIVPPWTDDGQFGEVPAMHDASYAVHPWDALSEESPDYFRRTFGSDYQGDPVGRDT